MGACSSVVAIGMYIAIVLVFIISVGIAIICIMFIISVMVDETGRVIYSTEASIGVIFRALLVGG